MQFVRNITSKIEFLKHVMKRHIHTLNKTRCMGQSKHCAIQCGESYVYVTV